MGKERRLNIRWTDSLGPSKTCFFPHFPVPSSTGKRHTGSPTLLPFLPSLSVSVVPSPIPIHLLSILFNALARREVAPLSLIAKERLGSTAFLQICLSPTWFPPELWFSSLGLSTEELRNGWTGCHRCVPSNGRTVEEGEERREE